MWGLRIFAVGCRVDMSVRCLFFRVLELGAGLACIVSRVQGFREVLSFSI